MSELPWREALPARQEHLFRTLSVQTLVTAFRRGLVCFGSWHYPSSKQSGGIQNGLPGPLQFLYHQVPSEAERDSELQQYVPQICVCVYALACAHTCAHVY